MYGLYNRPLHYVMFVPRTKKYNRKLSFWHALPLECQELNLQLQRILQEEHLVQQTPLNKRQDVVSDVEHYLRKT